MWMRMGEGYNIVGNRRFGRVSVLGLFGASVGLLSV